MKYKVKQNGDTLLDSVYANRNLNDNIIDNILYSQIWEEPSNYINIHEGYKLLMDIINEGGNIGIPVDPDVDGYASVATIFNFIYDDLKYDNVWYIIKNKSKKGHGIDKEIIEKVEKNKFKLLIMVDGGTNDIGYQNKLYDMGCEVLILDHHNIEWKNNRSPAIIINNQDGQVENTNLSGCGVTYKFCYYVAEQEGIDLKYKYLDLVALSLISDVCDMREYENRYLFNMGCQKSNVTNKLIKAFAKDLKIKNKFSIEDYGWQVSPLMNAIIRMSDGKEKEDLLESLIGSNETVEYKYRGKTIEQSIHDSILRCGRRLKNKQKSMVEKAISNGIEVLNKEDDKVLIVNSTLIQPEIRGLVANKLMGEYKKPVLLVTGEDVLRGSARGLNSFSFKDLCDKSMLFNETGGHSGAFGVSLNRCNVGKFIEFCNKELLGIDMDNFTEIDYVFEGGIDLDSVLDLSGDLEDLWQSNYIPRPKMLIKNMRIDSSKIIKKGIDLSYKDDNGVIYKRNFCSKIFYQDLIKEEENPNHDKMLNVDMIVEVKTTENNKSYVNILEFVSNIVELN